MKQPTKTKKPDQSGSHIDSESNLIWEAWRLDDNNNEFLMKRFSNKEAAEEYCKTFERRGHKQTYFVRRTH